MATRRQQRFGTAVRAVTEVAQVPIGRLGERERFEKRFEF